MSITQSLQHFDQQLLLKLTLGQQLKQPLLIPEDLKAYTDQENLLALNQVWVLMQQAGYRAHTATHNQLKHLQRPEQSEVTVQEKISPELIQALQLILQKIDPKSLREEEIYISKIVRLATQQNKFIPRYILLELFKLKYYDLDDDIFAKIIPDSFYQCDKTSLRVGRIKAFKKYAQSQQDPQVFMDYLTKLYRDDLSKVLFVLRKAVPCFYQQYIGEILRLRHNDLGFNTAYANLKQFKVVYDEIKSEANSLHSLARFHLYYQNDLLYPQVEETILKYIHYDVQNHQIQLDASIEQMDIFEQYTLERDISDEVKTELRKILKRKEKDKMTEDDLQNLTSDSGYKNIYLKDIFGYLPLSLWEKIFDNFDQLLILDENQKVGIWIRFVERCKLEDRHDLLQWFYQKEPLWCESRRNEILSLLIDQETEQFIVSRLAEHLETKEQPKIFYFILEQKKYLLADQKITAWAKEMLDYMIISKEIYRESLLELMMLEGYPIDFSPYQSLLSKYKWQVLSAIVQEKHHLLNQTM